jgi:hypothetical protein
MPSCHGIDQLRQEGLLAFRDSSSSRHGLVAGEARTIRAHTATPKPAPL